MTSPASGYLPCGVPYCRVGRGPRPLVNFQGLLFENTPPSRFLAGAYRFLGEDYTVYVVLRKPGMPHGYTLADMAGDYATMIRQEFGGPVDVIGVSTGGSIAHHFAAEHGDLVRRLVLQSSAYTLNPAARQAQMQVARLAGQGKWAAANALMMSFLLPQTVAGRATAWLLAHLLSLKPPRSARDLVVTVEAEDDFDFKTRLAGIAAPTLVIAGAADPFYSEQLFRETAAGIPQARLILYPGMGHPASGKQFERAVLTFLREDRT